MYVWYAKSDDAPIFFKKFQREHKWTKAEYLEKFLQMYHGKYQQKILIPKYLHDQSKKYITLQMVKKENSLIIFCTKELLSCVSLIVNILFIYLQFLFLSELRLNAISSYCWFHVMLGSCIFWRIDDSFQIWVHFLQTKYGYAVQAWGLDGWHLLMPHCMNERKRHFCL